MCQLDQRLCENLLVFTLVFMFCGPQWSIARITEPDINIFEKHGGQSKKQKVDPELNIRIKVRQVMCVCGPLTNNMLG